VKRPVHSLSIPHLRGWTSSFADLLMHYMHICVCIYPLSAGHMQLNSLSTTKYLQPSVRLYHPFLLPPIYPPPHRPSYYPPLPCRISLMSSQWNTPTGQSLSIPPHPLTWSWLTDQHVNHYTTRTRPELSVINETQLPMGRQNQYRLGAKTQSDTREQAYSISARDNSKSY